MISLTDIKAPVKKNMDEFDDIFKLSIKSKVPLLDKIVRYILKQKGKQIRPLFVFLTAKMIGEINKSTYTAASLIELLHSATLIHDDVVDDSNQRRGFFSINALWKNKIAVLVGDFMLSKGLLVALENDEFELLKIVSNATKEMSEGELLQIEKSRFLNIDEAVYFEIIRKKTASLIASCCACGASSVTKDTEIINKMKEFGECVGIAFQIKDDLLDFESPSKTGKPSGVDIKEKKLSLPIIYMLNNMSFLEKRKIMTIIKNHNDEASKVQYVINRVKESQGIDYSFKKMTEYKERALGILAEFENCDAKNSLEQLVRFTIERSY
jgi:octaprenyl-diphosphate synthase